MCKEDNGAIEATGDFCPYVGLAPFEEQHMDYYFGRDLDAATLTDNVLTAPITVLYGASGVGKTSLLNVGLKRALDQIQEDAILVIFRQWQGDDFYSNLLRTIVKALNTTTVLSSHYLRRASRDLLQFAAWTEKHVAKTLSLVFDQFEEYFFYQSGVRGRRFESDLDALTNDGAQLLSVSKTKTLQTT